MRKPFIRSLMLVMLPLLYLLGVGLAQQQLPSSKATPTAKPPLPKISSHVVIIVVDGLGADLLNAQRKQLPKLTRQMSQGVVANIVEGVYPSLTEPAQATIATGMLPVDHGIFSHNETVKLTEMATLADAKATKNIFIWESATKAGLSVAAIEYKLTKDAAIKFNLLDLPRQQQDKKIKNNNYKSVSYRSALNADEQCARKACELIKSAQPNLLLINFRALTFALNQFGTTAKEVNETLAKLDSWIDQILFSTEEAKIQKDTTILIVSDSGRADIENEFNPNVVLVKKGWLNVDEQGNISAWKAVAVPLEGAAAIIVKNQSDEKAVEALFREIHKTPDSPIWRIFNRQEISRVGTLPQAALMIDAAPSFSFGGSVKGNMISKSQQKTASGYSPQRLEMRPIFIAFGKGIKQKGSLKFMRLTDVAPTVARILGIMHGARRGRTLTEILQP
jgi:predicted AlkP superfamily pyrophosphatase or phosphodiesterase